MMRCLRSLVSNSVLRTLYCRDNTVCLKALVLRGVPDRYESTHEAGGFLEIWTLCSQKRRVDSRDPGTELDIDVNG